MRFTTILIMALTMTLATAAPAPLKAKETCTLESASDASLLDCLVGWEPVLRNDVRFTFPFTFTDFM
ncbi:uncharacterized protein DSM5745_09257 [Aspergillus mulundensis]|uniref:Uncharacterized protein n=1 Tax=Aspergillus mulundensis TaxID=1810919 RepID=A0A3D8R0F7_9EURO|nr:hypothetical protein DSM5745_09257 [Aspergillus mulundensis]RDW67391.1 hypothetical protein DSM5745_09257 [Aspergillus mulundensis]